MEQISLFSLANHAGPYELWPPKTKLFFDGRPTGAAIPGYVIEAQYQLDDRYLLITSYDCMFEESNDFVLLNSGFRVLAANRLGAAYDSYLLHAHWSIAPNAIRLHYNDDLFFDLTVEKKAGFFSDGCRLVLDQCLKAETDPMARASVEEHRARVEAIRQYLARGINAP